MQALGQLRNRCWSPAAPRAKACGENSLFDDRISAARACPAVPLKSATLSSPNTVHLRYRCHDVRCNSPGKGER
jgi:hypothetical protein